MMGLLSQPVRQRLLVGLLLVVYGSAGVLGYGLHILGHHHHDHSSACSHEACHQKPVVHACHGHGCSHSSSHSVETVHQAEEDCSICAFLAQAQTPYFEVTLTQTVSELGIEPPVSESIAPLFIPADHLARGPPLC